MPVTILGDPTYAPDPAVLGSPVTITTRVKGKTGAVRCVYKLSDTNDLFFRAGGGTAKKVELTGQLTGAAGGEALAQKVTLVRGEGDRDATGHGLKRLTSARRSRRSPAAGAGP